jgi:hypothetical protein
MKLNPDNKHANVLQALILQKVRKEAEEEKLGKESLKATSCLTDKPCSVSNYQNKGYLDTDSP